MISLPVVASAVLLLIQTSYRRGFGLPSLSGILFYILVFVAVLALITVAALERPRVSDTLAHWHVTIPGLHLKPQDFYSAVISETEKPKEGRPIDIETVELSEGAGIVYYRPYLRIRHINIACYIYAAPLGNSFFISSWLVIRRSLLKRLLPRLPIIGWLFSGVARLFETETFFTYDSALHFHEMTHAALLRSVDKLTSKASLPALAPELKKPVMRELYAPASPLQLPPGQ